MSQRVYPIKMDASGTTRLVYSLKWDPILDAANSEKNAEILESIKQVEMFQGLGIGAAKMVRRMPFLMRVGQRAAANLVDLEAVALLVKQGEVVGFVDGESCYALDGGIIHSGDDITGTSGPFDEEINFQLESLPPDVDAVALMIDSARGHALGAVRNAACQIAYSKSSEVIADFNLDSTDTQNISHFFGFVRRGAGGFEFSEVNYSFDGSSHDDVAAALKKYL